MKKDKASVSASSGEQKINLYKILICSCAILFAAITFVLEPISVWTLSDITVSVSIVPDIINIILELAENLAFAVCYSIIIYAAILRSSKAAFALCGVYAIACFVRRLAVLGITYVTYSYIDATDIFNVCAYLLLEVAMALTVVAFSTFLGKRYRAQLAQKQKAAQALGNLSLVEEINFSSVFTKSNPIQCGALFAGVMLSFIKIAMRINHDIKYTKIYGAPDGVGEILTMIVYYTSDILVGVIFYALAWLITSKLLQRSR